jgi:hypothetical protein
VRHGFLEGSRFLAIPYFQWNRDIMRIAEKYYVGVRAWDVDFETVPPDPYNIRCFVVVSTTDPETVKQLVDRAREYDARLILLFHVVSGNITRYETEYPMEEFAEIIDYINRTGVRVVTFSDVFDGNLGPARSDYEDSGKAILSANTTRVTVHHNLPLKPQSGTGNARKRKRGKLLGGEHYRHNVHHRVQREASPRHPSVLVCRQQVKPGEGQRGPSSTPIGL